MSAFLVLLLLLYFLPARVRPTGSNIDYLSKEGMAPVKGFFVLLVFATHFVQYVKLGGPWHSAYLSIRGWMAQLVVVPFLFYSGYGVMTSILNRGWGYVDSLPSKRVLKVLFMFDVAVLLFIAVQYHLGHFYTLKKVAWTFLAWESIGNSNWYILAMLVLYLLTYCSFKATEHLESTKARHGVSLGILSLLTLLFAAILSKYRPGYYYNTVFCYVLGMVFVFVRPALERFLLASRQAYLATFVALALSLWILGGLRSNPVGYQTWAMAFALTVVLFTMKCSSRSPILAYCGRHLFSLYILQRLPMILLQKTDFAKAHKYGYFLVCLAATFVLAAAFDFVVPRIWAFLPRLFRKLPFGANG